MFINSLKSHHGNEISSPCFTSHSPGWDKTLMTRPTMQTVDIGKLFAVDEMMISSQILLCYHTTGKKFLKITDIAARGKTGTNSVSNLSDQSETSAIRRPQTNAHSENRQFSLQIMFSSSPFNSVTVCYFPSRFAHIYLCGINYQRLRPNCCKSNSFGDTDVINWDNACRGPNGTSTRSRSLHEPSIHSG